MQLTGTHCIYNVHMYVNVAYIENCRTKEIKRYSAQVLAIEKC